MKVYTDFAQGSDEWFKVKAKKIGGTMSGPMSSETPGDVIYTLAGQIDTGRFEETYQSQAMRRGVELEIEGIMALEQDLGEKIEKVAFCESLELDFLGFSPDGLFAKRFKVVEMKCPNAGTHVKYNEDNEELINAYRNQVRQSFIVCPSIVEVLICSFHPHSHKPLIKVPVKRNYFTEKELNDAKLNMKINYKLATRKANKLKY